MGDRHFRVTLTRRDGYVFGARGDNEAWPEWVLDEPEPIGEDQGPNATRVLGIAVGHCLAASLLFCLSKARVPVEDLGITVDGTVARNDEGRLRVSELRVELSPTIPQGTREAGLTRCVDLFEDFCIVSASVRNGITIHVDVSPTAS
jgi:uncharacterized OsmC-like protein